MAKDKEANRAKARGKKLKVEREPMKNLEPRKAKQVKGGGVHPTAAPRSRW